jgi:hypothetical protein
MVGLATPLDIEIRDQEQAVMNFPVGRPGWEEFGK